MYVYMSQSDYQSLDTAISFRMLVTTHDRSTAGVAAWQPSSLQVVSLVTHARAPLR